MPLIMRLDADTKAATSKIKKASKSAGASVKKLEKDSVKSANKISSSFKGIAGALSIGLAIRTIDNLIDKYGIQEKALARLDANVKNVLVSFRGFEKGSEELTQELARSTEALINQARELQKVTTFGDEQTISAQAMLSTFALTTEQVMKLTPALLDMAAASEKSTGSQVDLEQIAIAVGKSLTIGVGALTRYGVVISDAARENFKFASDAEKVNIVLEELNKNFAGVAEAIGQTDIGKLERFGNIMGDLQERAGKVAVDVLLPLVEVLQKFGGAAFSGIAAGISASGEEQKKTNEATEEFLDLIREVDEVASRRRAQLAEAAELEAFLLELTREQELALLNVSNAATAAYVDPLDLFFEKNATFNDLLLQQKLAFLGIEQAATAAYIDPLDLYLQKLKDAEEEIPGITDAMEAAADAAGQLTQNLARGLISGQGLEKSLLNAALNLGLSFLPGGSLFGRFQHGGIAPGGFVPSIVGEGGGAPEIVQSASPIKVTPINKTTNNNDFGGLSFVFPNVRNIDRFTLENEIMPQMREIISEGGIL